MKFSEITECPECHSKFIKHSLNRCNKVDEKECIVCFWKSLKEDSTYEYEITENLKVTVHNWRYFEYKGLIRDVYELHVIQYIEEHDLLIVLGHEELLTIFSDGSEISVFTR